MPDTRCIVMLRRESTCILRTHHDRHTVVYLCLNYTSIAIFLCWLLTFGGLNIFPPIPTGVVENSSKYRDTTTDFDLLSEGVFRCISNERKKQWIKQWNHSHEWSSTMSLQSFFTNCVCSRRQSYSKMVFVVFVFQVGDDLFFFSRFYLMWSIMVETNSNNWKWWTENSTSILSIWIEFPLIYKYFWSNVNDLNRLMIYHWCHSIAKQKPNR